jgi:hypothetical protein
MIKFADAEGAAVQKSSFSEGIPSAHRRQTVDSRLLTMKCPFCRYGDEWKWISKSIAVV